MTEAEIRATILAMPISAQADIYHICHQAYDEAPAAVQRITELFGDCSLSTLHIVSNVSYNALTPTERNTDYIDAQRELQKALAVPADDAEQYMADRASSISPLKAIRNRAGYSVRSLARVVGVSPVTISYIESGKVTPRVDILRRIADELGCSLDELWPKGCASHIEKDTDTQEK